MMRPVRSLNPALIAALCWVLALVWPGVTARADPAPFDLAGPTMAISVTRQGTTLPIAAVQFHPEASPGPFDARGLFRDWLGSLH